MKKERKISQNWTWIQRDDAEFCPDTITRKLNERERDETPLMNLLDIFTRYKEWIKKVKPCFLKKGYNKFNAKKTKIPYKL